MKTARAIRTVFCMGLALTLCATSASADTYAWDDGGTGNNWSTNTNWHTDIEPTASDLALLGTAVSLAAAEITLAGEVALGVVVGHSSSGGGQVNITGGDLTIGTQDLLIGRQAPGVFNQLGGTVTANDAATVGSTATGPGTYTLTAGDLAVSATLNVAFGNSSTGTMVQAGGTVNVGALAIGTDSAQGTAQGTYTLSNGMLTSSSHQYIGMYGNGVLNQSGGTNTVNGWLYMAQQTTGSGEYNLTGGTLDMANGSGSPMRVGWDSTATLNIGNATGSGEITQSGAAVDMTVRYKTTGDGGAAASGTVRGWSGSRIGLTGNLYNNSRVIADGYGTARSLDFSTMANVLNTIENGLSETNGWFAQDKGELILPALTGATVLWGEDESGDDGTIDLINSAALDFASSQTVTGRLYAVDHGSVNTLGAMNPISVHEFSVGVMSSCDLTIRYDHVAAANAGLAEGNLKIFQWSGSAWSDVTSSLDTGNRLITASNLTSLGQFAISAPPPPQGTVITIQ